MPTCMHIEMVQNERTSGLVNIVKLCFHWLICSDMDVIGQHVSTPLCTHKHTHKHIQTLCLLYLPCVELSGWHHLQLQCQRVKGDHCLAALAPCPSAPLWVCVSVCCQRDSVTSLIKFGFLEFSFMYIYTHSIINTAFIFSTVSLSSCVCRYLIFSSPPSFSAPPFLLIPPPTVLLLSASHPPSVLLAQIDRSESLGLFILPSEAHIVSESIPLSVALYVYNQAGNIVQYLQYVPACVAVKLNKLKSHRLTLFLYVYTSLKLQGCAF